MAFSSNTFLFCFLPVMLLVYHIVRKELHGIVLLLGSYLFYAWTEPKALLVLLGVTVLSYGSALLIQQTRKKGMKPVRVLLLTMAILLDIGILTYFKYVNFLIDAFNAFTGKGIALRQIMLPVGISFFIFQSISYLVDVYRGKIDADRNLLRVALYFGMFPKMTQGPIMRYGDMADDLRNMHTQPGDFFEGVRRFIYGLTKKLLLADILGGVADAIFALELSSLSTPLAWGGIIAYSLQIYFDFSGYSDMAVGLGRMFGFRLMENFNHPYIATSITEFWRRWHISLSTWFKDYIYIPLGGNRRGNQYFNLFMVFVVTGIWHGAAWTFIVWGLLHGVVRLLEKMLMDRKIHQRIPAAVRWLITMLVVMSSWVLFRATSLDGAVGYLKAMVGFGGDSPYTLGWYYNSKIALLTVVAILAAVPWKECFPTVWEQWKDTYLVLWIERIALALMLVLCVMLAMTSTYTSFIYFQF